MEKNGMEKDIIRIKNWYIIFEKNRKGKEYDKYNDTLVFEGKYLNGKRNGKGKEYYFDGRLRFEGEYLNEKEMERKRILW